MTAKNAIFDQNPWQFGIIAILVWAWLAPCHAQTQNRIDLRDNWFIQNSCKVQAPAEVLSTTRFAPDHWIRTTVPSTVLAAQVAAGEFKDIYYAEHQILKTLPTLIDNATEPQLKKDLKQHWGR